MKRDNEEKRYGIASLAFRAERNVARISPIASVLMKSSLLFNAALAGVNTWFIARTLNTVEKTVTNASLMKYVYIDTIILILIYLIRRLLNGVFEGSMVRVDSKTLYNLQIELRKKCTKLPLIFYEDSENINELERAKFALYGTRISDLVLSFYNCSAEIISVITVSIVLFLFNKWLVLISLLSVIPYLIIRYIRGNMFYELKWFQAKNERKKNYLFKLYNNKQSVKELRVFTIEEYIKNKWKNVRDDINNETWDFKKKDILSLLFCDVLKNLGYLLSVAFVVRFAIRGEIHIGDMSAAMLAFLNFQNSMKYFLINMARISECGAFAKDFFKFMDLKEESLKRIETTFEENISLNNVSFKYPNTDYVIRNISINIHPKEKVVIVGENGSGKTTLTKLMLGLYDCEKGEILYGNKKVNEIDYDYLYNKIAVVNQDFVKYALSVRQNIKLNEDDHDDEKIMEILRRLELEDILGQDGLDTMLGTEFGGKELSQGQWQKLAIARAIYRNPDIIFLDEPTSALDPVIENEILMTFLEMMENKTAIIVSHRVGLCKAVDKIIVMKEGNVCEVGNHDELMKAGGEYYRLYSTQSQWYEN